MGQGMEIKQAEQAVIVELMRGECMPTNGKKWIEEGRGKNE